MVRLLWYVSRELYKAGMVGYFSSLARKAWTKLVRRGSILEAIEHAHRMQEESSVLTCCLSKTPVIYSPIYIVRRRLQVLAPLSHTNRRDVLIDTNHKKTECAIS